MNGMTLWRERWLGTVTEDETQVTIVGTPMPQPWRYSEKPIPPDPNIEVEELTVVCRPVTASREAEIDARLEVRAKTVQMGRDPWREYRAMTAANKEDAND